VTPSRGGDTRTKKNSWLNLQRIYKKQWTKEVDENKEVSWTRRCHPLHGGDTRVKSIKVTVMSKKGRQVFFRKKIGVTPSVAAPGDIDPSDATGYSL